MEVTTIMPEDNRLHGHVSYKMFDKNHNLVSSGEATNTVVLGIREPIIQLLGGFNSGLAELPFIQKLKLGNMNGTPTTEDTSLWGDTLGETETHNTPTFEGGNYPSVTFSFMFPADDPTLESDDIHEMGLYTTKDRMVAHVDVGTWRKVPGLYFEVYWTIGYQAPVAN